MHYKYDVICAHAFCDVTALPHVQMEEKVA